MQDVKTLFAEQLQDERHFILTYWIDITVDETLPSFDVKLISKHECVDEAFEGLTFQRFLGKVPVFTKNDLEK
jgi:hypothetical protein